jgi:hypothetical protein
VFTQQSERSPTLGRRDAQTAAVARRQNSRNQNSRILLLPSSGVCGKPEAAQPSFLISDL